MNDAQVSSGALIAKYRRCVDHCLYCLSIAKTAEHIVPEAIGGRLTADILCSRHNGVVNAADEVVNKNFAPYITMLQVQRQRGGAGAEFTATDDTGKRVTILAAGFAKQKALEVHKRDEHGRILHATGDLRFLEAIPRAAFSKKDSSNIIAVISNPQAQFAVASDERIAGGVFKMALHFYGGFIGDVSVDQSAPLLKVVVGQTTAGGSFVRTPLLRPETFPESWPPRHELTAYPFADHCLVTVLLFGVYGYVCRLPFRATLKRGLRYTQVLNESYPRLEEDLPIPASLDWDDRPKAEDREEWAASIKSRLDPILRTGQEQAVQARCERAWQRAVNESHNLGDIWARYKAALELETFLSHEVLQLIAIGQHLALEGREPWEVPVVFAEDV